MLLWSLYLSTSSMSLFIASCFKTFGHKSLHDHKHVKLEVSLLLCIKEYFLNLSIQHELPLVMVGKSGVGKTFISTALIEGLSREKFDNNIINFSARTNVNYTQGKAGLLLLCVVELQTKVKQRFVKVRLKLYFTCCVLCCCVVSVGCVGEVGTCSVFRTSTQTRRNLLKKIFSRTGPGIIIII